MQRTTNDVWIPSEHLANKYQDSHILTCLYAQVEPPVYVPADLSKMDLGTALASTGFDATVPTLFTMEGLIYYLPPSAARKLVKRITQLSAPGSKVSLAPLDVGWIEL
jgi:O-methyltransferase involved in polyketide biosynthesis